MGVGLVPVPLADRIVLVVLVDASPAHAFHVIGLIDAFWKAVQVNRGGSQPSASNAGFTNTITKPKPQCTIVEGAHRLVDVLRGLCNRSLRHDTNTFAAARVSKVLQITLAH